MCSTKTCNKCGIEKDLDLFPKQGKVCKLCTSITTKIYRQENKDKIEEIRRKSAEKNKERSKVYRQENKDKIKERRKKYYTENREKIIAYNKEYDQKNKDKKLMRNNKWRQENKEKVSESNKRYGQENREKRYLKNKLRGIAYKEKNRDRILERGSLYGFLRYRGIKSNGVSQELIDAVNNFIKARKILKNHV